jgi:membrane protein DedA with SNARE-associated domain
MEQLIATYGYPVIFAGTFFEGETVVLIAGYLANRGYLALEWVILAAFLGSWFGDTVYFFIGRRWGNKLLDRWPTWRQPADRALDMLHRYHAVFILSFRFLYGLRTVSPFVIGMSKVPTARFIVLNMVASAIWATAFSSGGYLLGTVLQTMIGKVKHYEGYVLGALVAAGLIAWLVHMQVMRRRQRTIAPARIPSRVRPGRQKGPDDAS